MCQSKKEKIWCEHIFKAGKGYCIAKDDRTFFQYDEKNFHVQDGWEFCPICGKPKPDPRPQAEIHIDEILDRFIHEWKLYRSPPACDPKEAIKRMIMKWRCRHDGC